MNHRRRKPHHDQPLLPLRDERGRTRSDLDREVEQWSREVRREPIDGQRELPIAKGEKKP